MHLDILFIDTFYHLIHSFLYRASLSQTKKWQFLPKRAKTRLKTTTLCPDSVENAFLTLMGEFPGYELDRINGKLIQQKIMTSYQLLDGFSGKTVQFMTPKLKFRKNG